MAQIEDPRFTIVDHPLVQHKLSILRDKDTTTKDFRELVTELAILEGYEAMRDLPLENVNVETPLEECTCRRLAGKKIAIIPILRAGLGMVDGILSLVPSARVGHVGMYRDPETHEPVQYYCKFPPAIQDRTCLVVDPMLATGGSLGGAVQFLVDRGADHITCICLLAAPEGIENMRALVDPVGVPCTLVVAAVDERLNDHGYIVPGLGDAGDRLYGLAE